MPETPLISIITVNLNDVIGLKRTMTSVFGQTFKEVEYIVIDGGSTDGSKDYIENHSDKINYWVSEKDSGIYNAMNKGIKVANGEYLLFLNSGDHFISRDILQQNYKFLKFYDLIYFDLQIMEDTRTFIKSYSKDLTFSYLLEHSLPHPATFIKASLFDKFGLYDEGLKIVSDWKFFMDCVCRFNVSYFKVNKTLSTFYLDGLSSHEVNKSIIQEEKATVLKSNFKPILRDLNRLFELESLVSQLRTSKKINLLVKFGFLKKF